MAEEMVGMIEADGLAKVSGTEPTKTETHGHGTYPFPGPTTSIRSSSKTFRHTLNFPGPRDCGGVRLSKSSMTM